MSDPPFSPTVALLAMSRMWESALSDALEPLGLTIRKYGLLGHIRANPDISFSELARRSRITVQSAHTSVASLSASGLVDDGTAHAGSASTLRLTRTGKALLVRATRATVRLDAKFAVQQPELTAALRVQPTEPTNAGILQLG